MSPKTLLPLLIGIWLCGCISSQPARTCTEILAPDLHALLTQQTSNEQLRSKIATLYDLSLDKVDSSSNGFRWNKDGMTGTLITEQPFTNEHTLTASIEYTEHPPSTDLVLGCLGTPDAYGAWYLATPGSNYQPFLIFDMYFVKQGIAARVVQAGARNQPPRLDGTNTITELFYVAPSSPAKTMELLTFGNSTERKAKIKPWPGSWQNIVIDIEPSAR